eukprot:6186874-Pleurochrysis_carterae.AAC.4
MELHSRSEWDDSLRCTRCFASREGGQKQGLEHAAQCGVCVAQNVSRRAFGRRGGGGGLPWRLALLVAQRGAGRTCAGDD